jgi:hypothetical protein
VSQARRLPILEAPDEIAELLRTELPDLHDGHADLLTAVHDVMSFVHGGSRGTAVGSITTQAVNTFADILYDVERGRGRSATSGTRVLFELVVTLRDVLSSGELDERYRLHEWVTLQQETELSLELSHLPKKERRATAHRQKTQRRDNARQYERVIDRFGSRFAHSWADASLADRAARNGLGDEYTFYRVASALLHGSHGGVVGLRSTIGGATVFRFGPALALCPRAYLRALRYFEYLIADLGERAGPSRIDVLSRVRALRRQWHWFHKAAHRVDRAIWPREPPSPPVLVLAVKDGTRTWYVHDAGTASVAEANEPNDLPVNQRSALDEMTQEIDRRAAAGEIVTVAVFDAQPVPKSGAEWLPETFIFPHLAPVDEEARSD